MNLDLDGTRILVTGGSSGLGLACAEALVEEGARVALNARDGSRLTEAAGRISAVAVPADLSTPDGPRAAVEGAIEALGGLDRILISSGGPPPGDFDALDEKAWATAIDGTLLSVLRLIRTALPALRSGTAPAITVILSSSVRSPIPGLTTSNVLRPGLAGLVKTLSIELAPQIRVNGIAPGRLDTERVASLDEKRAEKTGSTAAEVRTASEAAIPLGRYGRPRELGDVSAFLLSERASYLTGSIINVDGGSAKALP